MRGQPFTWHIQNDVDETVVTFSGDLDERVSLEELPPLSGKVTFDLGGIRRVSSGGVTRWVKFLGALEVERLLFVRCSIPVVAQLNMVRGFRGGAKIRSFYAPYVCMSTGEEQEVLLAPEQVRDVSNPPRIASKDGELVLNDLPNRYFAFLARERS